MNDTMTVTEKTDIETLLNEKVAEVTFTKKDGERRVMKCTANLDLIPKEFHPADPDRNASDSVKQVFDMDKSAWRSFRWDSVQTVATFN